MLAGIHVSPDWVSELARMVKRAGAVELAARLDQAIVDSGNDPAAMVALTIDERAVILAALEDPPLGLAERRGVLVNEHRRTPWLCS